MEKQFLTLAYSKEIVIRILLNIAVSAACENAADTADTAYLCEKSCSKLKLIKTHLMNLMDPEMLINLTLLNTT